MRKTGLAAAFIYFVLLGIAITHEEVYAAPVTFTASTTVSLTSPAATLTIASGSVADTLTVNSGTVVVALSSSTGGNFILTSALNLTVSTSSGGGTVSQTCISGVASTSISQSTGSTNYTITPGSSACGLTISGIGASTAGNNATISWTTNFAATSTLSYGLTTAYGSTVNDANSVTSHSITISGLTLGGVTYHYSVTSASGATSATSGDQTFTTPNVVTTGGGSVSGGGGGGGGGGGSGYYAAPLFTPVATTTSASVATTTASSTPTATSFSLLSPQDQLNALLAQLRALQTQAGALGQPAQSPSSPSQKFAKNLSLGSQGSTVTSLQQFLIARASGPAAQKLAVVGASGRFGPLTKKALIEFQKSVGIAPASGYFGPKTRAYINALGQ